MAPAPAAAPSTRVDNRLVIRRSDGARGTIPERRRCPLTVWFTVQLDDRPGSLARVATALAERGVNITGIVGVAEDPEVYWELGHRKSHAAADLHKAQREVGDEPGHTVFLKNPTKDGEFWTIEDWLDYSDESDAQILERGAPEGARPPTPEELTEMREKRRRAAAEAEPIE